MFQWASRSVVGAVVGVDVGDAVGDVDQRPIVDGVERFSGRHCRPCSCGCRRRGAGGGLEDCIVAVFTHMIFGRAKERRRLCECFFSCSGGGVNDAKELLHVMTLFSVVGLVVLWFLLNTLIEVLSIAIVKHAIFVLRFGLNFLSFVMC